MADKAVGGAGSTHALTNDEARLHALGYTQDLLRSGSALFNFGVCFSVIGFLAASLNSFAVPWFRGGPVVVLCGWLLAACGSLTVASSLAEICGVFPVSGGLYYWSFQLGGRHARFMSWFAGWFNLLGQLSALAGAAMTAALQVQAFIVAATSPTRANRHGGASLATIATLPPNAVGAPGPLLLPEPCPYDNVYALVTSFPWPAPDAYGNNFTSIEVAYDVQQCNSPPVILSQGALYGVYVAVLFAVATLNSFKLSSLSPWVYVSIALHIVGSILFIIVLPVVATSFLPSSLVWGLFVPGNLFPPNYDQAAPPGLTILQGNANGPFVSSDVVNAGGNGITSSALGENAVNPYIFLVGLLQACWVFTGYDSSAHLSEETVNSSVASPRGMVDAVLSSAVLGFFFLMAIVYSTVDFNNSLGGPFALSVSPALQIVWDAFETRFGSGRGSLGLWTFVILCAFLVTLACGTSSSRMFYAFARDGAIPASSFFHHLHPQLRIPRNSVWGCFVLASILGLPTLASNIAFNAVVSIAVIGLSISYACPIFGRLFLSPTYDASLGGFRLGRLSAPLAGAA